MSTLKANLEILPKGLQAALVLGLIALVACPFVASDFYKEMVTRMMILAIFAMSLDLLQGVTGLVSLGHAAYFGLAGYALAFLTGQNEAVSLWWTLPAAVLASSLAALVIGFFVVRTHGIYFIMVTMAFAQMVFFLFFDNKVLGGSDGMYINFKPSASILGYAPFDLDNKTHLYFFTLACMLAVYAGLRVLLFRPLGRTLSGIRVNEHRMRAVGYGTFGYKLTAFTIAGGLAGLAGYLFGAQSGYVNPELMGFHMSAHAIMMLILGGMGNFAGAIVGAFGFEMLLSLFKDWPTIQVLGKSIQLGKHWQLWMGTFIVLVVLFARNGLLGLSAPLRGAAKPKNEGAEGKTAAPRNDSVQQEPSPQSASLPAPRGGALRPLLSASHLTKRFGGLAAVNDVSIDLYRGQIHAVIGPNGAGKSTLTNLLSGDLPLSTGSIQLAHAREGTSNQLTEITGWSPERIARHGLGRSFQKTNVFLPFTVFENVRLAAHFDLQRTHVSIELAQLTQHTHTAASQLSHGGQRQLEIAMALATNPQVLLLDEPLAGMGLAEAERMIALLQSIKPRYAILLVEHDMDAVFALADTLTVMVDGVVIASDTPAAIRMDRRVQAAYLGVDHE